MEKKWFESDFVYDLESYPNCFTMTTIHASGKWLKTYEISDRKNEIEGLASCLRYLMKNNCRMVGFNNIGYDYQIIHEVIEILRKAKKNGSTPDVTALHLYRLTEKIISQMKDDGKNYGIRESEHYIKQVDLFKINHFDNKARATSLKVLEFNMRSENVEDLPFPVGKHLSSDDIDVLIKYNQHDVLQTLKFYYYCYEAILLRKELTQQFGFDCTNYNDTKIGKELFIQSLEEESPGVCYQMVGKRRTVRQTKRKEIVIAECLFPYIKFDRPEFQAVHEWFKKQVITETKGVFSDLLEHELGDVAKYAQMVIKRKKINNPSDSKDKKYIPTDEHIAELKAEYPLGWMEEKELKSPKGAKSYYWCYRVAETLNVVIDDFRYDFGVGGIHGAIQGTVESEETQILRTIDVASYYPNMAIANSVYPEHLGLTFCKVYKKLYEERKRHPKGSGANAALKLALNGVYGDSNNEFSALYDPKYTMTITIGGQLSLCMLAEKLIDECSASLVAINTDGMEFTVPVEMLEKSNEMVKWWESITGLEMEGDVYSKMMMRDVNSYIAVTESGKVKTKGAYEVMPFDKMGWHKNQSAMVIAMAVEAYLVRGEDYEQFILNHKNEYDFFLRTKVPRSSRLVMVKNGYDIPQQNICRYYPSNNGGKLVKIMPPLEKGGEERRLGIDTEWEVNTCNDVTDFQWDINYDYYISKAKELIDAVNFKTELGVPF